jgi:hypothetical protein
MNNESENVVPFGCIECRKIKEQTNDSNKFIYCLSCLKHIVRANMKRVLDDMSKDNHMLAAMLPTYLPMIDEALKDENS